MVYYETDYKRGGKRYTYRTKSLTPKHAQLRVQFKTHTRRCDTGIQWHFGVYSEVIATGALTSTK